MQGQVWPASVVFRFNSPTKPLSRLLHGTNATLGGYEFMLGIVAAREGERMLPSQDFGWPGERGW